MRTTIRSFAIRCFTSVLKNGFIFSSANFQGTSRSSQFPVGFLLWNLSESKRVEEQDIVIDVFNENVEKIALKHVRTENRESFLSKWIDRPPANIIFPPFGSAIEVKTTNKDRRDRIAEGFLASLMCKGNDFANQNYVSLLPGPYASAGALSVVPENFEKAMVVHAVRRIPKATWINDRDQFLQPNGELTDEFIGDCTVWNLFSNSNQTASLRNVEYEGRVYQIKNHFFPFPVFEVKGWKIDERDIAETLAGAEDTFVATWLAERTLSAEAKSVLSKGREIYRFYFENLSQLPTTQFKIELWDAGWWQIRNALSAANLAKELLDETKLLQNALKDKILPDIEKYGIL